MTDEGWEYMLLGVAIGAGAILIFIFVGLWITGWLI